MIKFDALFKYQFTFYMHIAKYLRMYDYEKLLAARHNYIS